MLYHFEHEYSVKSIVLERELFAITDKEFLQVSSGFRRDINSSIISILKHARAVTVSAAYVKHFAELPAFEQLNPDFRPVILLCGAVYPVVDLFLPHDTNDRRRL